MAVMVDQVDFTKLFDKIRHHPLNQLGWLNPRGVWVDLTVGAGGDVLWALWRGWTVLGFEINPGLAQLAEDRIQKALSSGRFKGHWLGVYVQDGCVGLAQMPQTPAVVYADWPFPAVLQEKRKSRWLPPQVQSAPNTWAEYEQKLREIYELWWQRQASFLILKLPVDSHLSAGQWGPHRVIKSPTGQVQWWVWQRTGVGPG